MSKTQGTAYLYGVSNTITNARVMSTSLEEGPANVAATPDEQGNVVGRHYDDVTTQGTFVIRIQSTYSIPTGDGGAVLAWNGNTYEITQVTRDEEAQGKRQVTLNVLRSANITSAAV